MAAEEKKIITEEENTKVDLTLDDLENVSGGHDHHDTPRVKTGKADDKNNDGKVIKPLRRV